jgi:hypothetical protein
MASTEMTAVDSQELTWGVMVVGLRGRRVDAPHGLEEWPVDVFVANAMVRVVHGQGGRQRTGGDSQNRGKQDCPQAR